MRCLWALPLTLAEEVAQLPWSPEPPRYHVRVGKDTALSLYDGRGPVGVDVGDTLLQRLSAESQGLSKWTVVEVYDSTCPHCWYAVPVYTHVAEAFEGVSSIQFTSLNCHMQYDMEACFVLNTIAQIKDFPSFLICPPRSTVHDPEIELPTKQAMQLFHALPKSHPTRKALLEAAHCHMKFQEDVKPGQEDPFLSAKQLALWVERVTGRQASNWHDLSIGANFHKQPLHVSAIAPPGRPGWLRDDQEGRPGVSRYIPGERWYDALMGFVAFIYQGYHPQKHQATVEVTRYLSMAFPVKGKELARLADSLEKHGQNLLPTKAQKVIASWSIDVGLGDPSFDASDASYEEPKSGLVHRLIGGNTSALQSLTCPTSSTCNLWNLLHVTCTAVAARGFSKRTLMGDGSILSHGFSGGTALPVTVELGIREAQAFVRTFVDNFLTCRQCRQRFIWDYDQCNYGRCEYKDWRSLPLWLWRVHNAINLHVASHEHLSTDRRWPMYQDCPRCWRQDLVMGTPRKLSIYDREALSESRWSTEELDMPFDKKAVFWHLIGTFVGVRRIIFDLADFTGEEKEEVKSMLHKQGIALPGGLPRQDLGFPGERLQPLDVSQSAHSASQIFLALLAMASGVAIMICYFGQDADGAMDIDAEDREFGREARAPMFRPAAPEAEPELVKDTPAPESTEAATEAAE